MNVHVARNWCLPKQQYAAGPVWHPCRMWFGWWDRQRLQAAPAPEQLAADMLRVAAVVKPVGHGSQSGAETELLPPADQLPAPHSRQPEPP